MSVGKTLYALSEKEYGAYINNIFLRRRLAHELLNHSLVIKEPDEWTSFYAVLCEYIAVLFRFEELLEKAILTGDWKKESNHWLLDEAMASTIILFHTSELACRDELLIHNVSLLLH